MTSVNDDKVLQLFQSMIKDPFYQAEGKRSREEVVLDEATRRIRQSSNNNKALSMAVEKSPAMKALLDYTNLQKAKKPVEPTPWENLKDDDRTALRAQVRAAAADRESAALDEQRKAQAAFTAGAGKQFANLAVSKTSDISMAQNRFNPRTPTLPSGRDITNNISYPSAKLGMSLFPYKMVEAKDKDGNIRLDADTGEPIMIPSYADKKVSFDIREIGGILYKVPQNPPKTKGKESIDMTHDDGTPIAIPLAIPKSIQASGYPARSLKGFEGIMKADLTRVEQMLQTIEDGGEDAQLRVPLRLHGRDNPALSETQRLRSYLTDFYDRLETDENLGGLWKDMMYRADFFNSAITALDQQHSNKTRRSAGQDFLKSFNKIKSDLKKYEESWDTLSESLGTANLETFGIDKTRKNSTRKHSFTPEESMRLMRLYQVEAIADALGEVHKEDGTPITPYSDFLEGFRFHSSDFSDEELAAIRKELEIGENDDIPDAAFLSNIHYADNDLVGDTLHNLEAGLKDTSDIIRGHTYVITQQGQDERNISNWSPYQNVEKKFQGGTFFPKMEQHIQGVHQQEQKEETKTVSEPTTKGLSPYRLAKSGLSQLFEAYRNGKMLQTFGERSANDLFQLEAAMESGGFIEQQIEAEKYKSNTLVAIKSALREMDKDFASAVTDADKERVIKDQRKGINLFLQSLRKDGFQKEIDSVADTDQLATQMEAYSKNLNEDQLEVFAQYTGKGIDEINPQDIIDAVQFAADFQQSADELDSDGVQSEDAIQKNLHEIALKLKGIVPSPIIDTFSNNDSGIDKVEQYESNVERETMNAKQIEAFERNLKTLSDVLLKGSPQNPVDEPVREQREDEDRDTYVRAVAAEDEKLRQQRKEAQEITDFQTEAMKFILEPADASGARRITSNLETLDKHKAGAIFTVQPNAHQAMGFNANNFKNLSPELINIYDKIINEILQKDVKLDLKLTNVRKVDTTPKRIIVTQNMVKELNQEIVDGLPVQTRNRLGDATKDIGKLLKTPIRGTGYTYGELQNEFRQAFRDKLSVDLFKEKMVPLIQEAIQTYTAPALDEGEVPTISDTVQTIFNAFDSQAPRNTFTLDDVSELLHSFRPFLTMTTFNQRHGEEYGAFATSDMDEAHDIARNGFNKLFGTKMKGSFDTEGWLQETRRLLLDSTDWAKSYLGRDDWDDEAFKEWQDSLLDEAEVVSPTNSNYLESGNPHNAFMNYAQNTRVNWPQYIVDNMLSRMENTLRGFTITSPYIGSLIGTDKRVLRMAPEDWAIENDVALSRIEEMFGTGVLTTHSGQKLFKNMVKDIQDIFNEFVEEDDTHPTSLLNAIDKRDKSLMYNEEREIIHPKALLEIAHILSIPQTFDEWESVSEGTEADFFNDDHVGFSNYIKETNVSPAVLRDIINITYQHRHPTSLAPSLSSDDMTKMYRQAQQSWLDKLIDGNKINVKGVANLPEILRDAVGEGQAFAFTPSQNEFPYPRYSVYHLDNWFDSAVTAVYKYLMGFEEGNPARVLWETETGGNGVLRESIDVIRKEYKESGRTNYNKLYFSTLDTSDTMSSMQKSFIKMNLENYQETPQSMEQTLPITKGFALQNILRLNGYQYLTSFDLQTPVGVRDKDAAVSKLDPDQQSFYADNVVPFMAYKATMDDMFMDYASAQYIRSNPDLANHVVDTVMDLREHPLHTIRQTNEKGERTEQQNTPNDGDWWISSRSQKLPEGYPSEPDRVFEWQLVGKQGEWVPTNYTRQQVEGARALEVGFMSLFSPEAITDDIVEDLQKPVEAGGLSLFGEDDEEFNSIQAEEGVLADKKVDFPKLIDEASRKLVTWVPAEKLQNMDAVYESASTVFSPRSLGNLDMFGDKAEYGIPDAILNYMKSDVEIDALGNPIQETREEEDEDGNKKQVPVWETDEDGKQIPVYVKKEPELDEDASGDVNAGMDEDGNAKYLKGADGETKAIIGIAKLRGFTFPGEVQLTDEEGKPIRDEETGLRGWTAFKDPLEVYKTRREAVREGIADYNAEYPSDTSRDVRQEMSQSAEPQFSHLDDFNAHMKANRSAQYKTGTGTGGEGHTLVLPGEKGHDSPFWLPAKVQDTLASGDNPFIIKNPNKPSGSYQEGEAFNWANEDAAQTASQMFRSYNPASNSSSWPNHLTGDVLQAWNSNLQAKPQNSAPPSTQGDGGVIGKMMLLKAEGGLMALAHMPSAVQQRFLETIEKNYKEMFNYWQEGHKQPPEEEGAAPLYKNLQDEEVTPEQMEESFREFISEHGLSLEGLESNNLILPFQMTTRKQKGMWSEYKSDASSNFARIFQSLGSPEKFAREMGSIAVATARNNALLNLRLQKVKKTIKEHLKVKVNEIGNLEANSNGTDIATEMAELSGHKKHLDFKDGINETWLALASMIEGASSADTTPYEFAKIREYEALGRFLSSHLNSLVDGTRGYGLSLSKDTFDSIRKELINKITGRETEPSEGEHVPATAEFYNQFREQLENTSFGNPDKRDNPWTVANQGTSLRRGGGVLHHEGTKEYDVDGEPISFTPIKWTAIKNTHPAMGAYLLHNTLLSAMPDIYKSISGEPPKLYSDVNTEEEINPAYLGPRTHVLKKPEILSGSDDEHDWEKEPIRSMTQEEAEAFSAEVEARDDSWLNTFGDEGVPLYRDEDNKVYVKRKLPEGHDLRDTEGSVIVDNPLYEWASRELYHEISGDMLGQPVPDFDELANTFATAGGMVIQPSAGAPPPQPTVSGTTGTSGTTQPIGDPQQQTQRQTQQTSFAGERPPVRSPFKEEKIRQHLLNSGISENEVDDYIASFDDNAFDKYYYAHVDSALRGEAAPKISDSPERQEKIDRIRQLNREQHQVDIYDDNHFKYMPDVEVDKLLGSTNEKYAEHQRQTTKQERVRTAADIQGRIRDKLSDNPTEAQLNQRAGDILREKLVNAPIWADNPSHPDVKEAKDHFKAMLQDLQSKATERNLDPLGNMAVELSKLPPNEKVNFMLPEDRQRRFIEDSQKQRDETEYSENLGQAYNSTIAENRPEVQNLKNFVQLFRNDDGTYRTRLVNQDNPMAFMEAIPGDEEGEISNFINQADIPSISDLTSGEKHKQEHSKEDVERFNNLPFYHPATDSWVDPVELRNSYPITDSSGNRQWQSINGFQHAGRTPEAYESKQHELKMTPEGHVYNHEFAQEHRNLANAPANQIMSDMHTDKFKQYIDTPYVSSIGDIMEPSEQTVAAQQASIEAQRPKGTALSRFMDGGERTSKEFNPMSTISRGEQARYNWRMSAFNPRNFIGTFLDIRKPNQLLDDRLMGSQHQLHEDMKAFHQENKVNEAYRRVAQEGTYDAEGRQVRPRNPDDMDEPTYYGSSPRALARARVDREEGKRKRDAAQDEARADAAAEAQTSQQTQQEEADAAAQAQSSAPQSPEQHPSGLNLTPFWDKTQQKPAQGQEQTQPQPQTQSNLNTDKFWENN